MKLIRTVLRLSALSVITALLFGWLVVTSVILGWVRGGGWLGPGTAAWRTRLFHRWCRLLLPVLGVRTEVHGEPPSAPFFLVSNHLSYVDVLVIAAQVPAVFVAKSEVADWPIMGTLCRAGDTLFIDRGNKRDIPRVMQQIESVLASQRGIVVFPEGSSTKGADVQRFRPGLLEAAASAGLPVSYAALSYRTPPGAAPAHLAVCWWGDMTFAGHVPELLGLPEVHATLHFGQERIQERDRKVLARRLHYAVQEQFQPVV